MNNNLIAAVAGLALLGVTANSGPDDCVLLPRNDNMAACCSLRKLISRRIVPGFGNKGIY